jgi:hypothetical protein
MCGTLEAAAGVAAFDKGVPMRCVAAAVALSLASAASAQVTISQVHADSTIYEADFVELFNAGNAPVDVNGWSVKWSDGGSGFWEVTPLSGVIPPHSYYLVAMGPSSGTQPLPPYQAFGGVFINGGAGKLMLSMNSDALIAQCPSLDSTVDIIFWGTVNCAGANPAPTMDGTNAILRANGGCTDTGNSANDFTLGAPSPRNTSTTHSCTTGPDCNGNGIDDTIEVQNPANDCNANGIPDGCDIVTDPSLDCNGNGVIDCTDFKTGAATDVNTNGTVDTCEGALVFPAATAVYVLNNAVSTDTGFWRIQGIAIEDVDGRPAPAYAAARWSNSTIAAALNSAHPGGWTISSVHLVVKKASDPVNGGGAFQIVHTNQDGVSLTPGNTGTRYGILASQFPDQTQITVPTYAHAAGQSDNHLLYSPAGPNTPGAANVLGEINAGTGELTIIAKPQAGTVAAPYAGASHPTLASPRLVIFASALNPCGTADFDGDGDTGTDADIEAFFACLAGNCCPTCFILGADFDGDGDVGTDADIESFFRVLAGGPC